MEQSPEPRPSGQQPEAIIERRVLPTVIAVALTLVGVAVGVWLVGGLGADTDDSTTSSPATSTPTAAPSTGTTSEPTSEPTAEPTSEPTTEPTTEPTASATTSAPAVADRSLAVGVFNQTRVTGLARRVAGQAQTAGWTVTAIGNWRGSVPADTVYYPAGREADGALLAADLGISRTMPAIATMAANRLTVVLVTPR